MEVRPGREDDIDAVLTLWGAARSPLASTPDTVDAVRAAIVAGALLVADDGGTVVGTLVAGWDGWRGHMYRLAVAEERRREGIARRLVDAGHERLLQLGARRVTALVGADEADVGAFWETVGYAPDPQIARFVRNL